MTSMCYASPEFGLIVRYPFAGWMDEWVNVGDMTRWCMER